ncbi:SUMF1/EgtB/PvdO family nonheme iron enzyme [Aquisphaera insulae]|uniref:SUMF1/EgtB/PvdO family nonheme iron enzyme n=1 Tax=Aquisphaera insulae TaxID=2712864 RepID=UPI0013EBC836|nr:SUMF1/EgtB/PvdO family nonheme iron enzyme [Aquisphaera insulae]
MRDRRLLRIAAALFLAPLIASPAPAQRRAKPGEAYALLVGVRAYDPNELHELAYPEHDVTALSEALRAGGYSATNVVLMTQTLGATRPRLLPLAANIRKELKLLLQDLEPADSVVVAFAGHGVQFSGEKSNFFCPADAKLADRSTLIPLDDVYKELEACKAGLKLLLVDACRNDPRTKNSRSRAEVELESLNRPQVVPPPGGVMAFFSCSEGEKAQEYEELKHGVFFHFVIKGLGGEADLDGDALISPEELAQYARRRVRDYVREKNGVRQMPELRGTTRDLLPVVRLARRAEPDATRDRPSRGGEAAAPISNSLGMKLVPIPAGEFLMGSTDDEDAEDDEKPSRRVRITRPFLLGTTEVTVGQFRRFVEATGYRTEAERGGKGCRGWNESKAKFEIDPRYSWRGPGFPQADDHPVTNVTWNDAEAFCTWLGSREATTYRLPTEAEWEYACRAGTTSRFSCGTDPEALASVANVADGTARSKFPDWTTIAAADGYVFTAPVGKFRANARGLHDMHGNVSEWCQDGYDARAHKHSPADDPVGPKDASRKVYRGGSWADEPRYARSARRVGIKPDYRCYDLGFRVARAAAPP